MERRKVAVKVAVECWIGECVGAWCEKKGSNEGAVLRKTIISTVKGINVLGETHDVDNYP